MSDNNSFNGERTYFYVLSALSGVWDHELTGWFRRQDVQGPGHSFEVVESLQIHSCSVLLWMTLRLNLQAKFYCHCSHPTLEIFWIGGPTRTPLIDFQVKAKQEIKLKGHFIIPAGTMISQSRLIRILLTFQIS